ncbi:hypothetical protein EYB31_16170 [Paenibacillus thalictri]|uniref:Mannosyl-glycoprotein endo-beta-N-acetylglucosamidase-like domain-containing protein n=1 Tax=Paenibacillus thalictri TaxID=2527873 RepID=A0A4Q9DR44_9BACL|nr:hypothetical protein EYB31_16170 [Paenibacillus thalictri]
MKGSGQEFAKQEYVNGHFVTVTDGFRVYDSLINHSNFLLSNGRYAAAGFLNCCKYLDYAGATRALQTAGYATDRNYAASLSVSLNNTAWLNMIALPLRSWRMRMCRSLTRASLRR